MATSTTNLGLIKPAGTDKIRIAQINQNMDVIDTKMGAVGNTPLQTQVTNLSDKVASVVWTPTEDTTLLSFLLGNIKDRGVLPFSFIKVGSVAVTDVPDRVRTNEFAGAVYGSDRRLSVKIWPYAGNYNNPAGAVYTKNIFDNSWTGDAQNARVWACTPSANTLAIEEGGYDNLADHAASAGRFVFWHGGLYTAKSNIAVGDTLSASNLTAVNNGGLNALKSIMDTLNSNTAKWTWERNPDNINTILQNIAAKQVSYVEILDARPVGMPSDLTGNQWAACITVGSTASYLRFQLIIPETGSSKTMYFRTRADGDNRWIKITGTSISATT